MSELPLVEGILKYLKEDNISFCMPGHKAGRGFIETLEGKELYDSFIKCDITEVEGTDNLHNAEGIIRESLELLSGYYGSSKSYFLVNGSTSGNLVMIFSAFNEGEKIIVERNCHRSVMNGMILRKLRPVYIKNVMNTEYNAPLSIDEEHLIQIIHENTDAKGIIITYPSYYGTCCNLKKIIDEAHSHGMKVLVDSAHGAHFGVNKSLPENAVKLGADMVVMSAHKTLPSLTQTAFLHVGKNVDKDRVDFYVSALLSTSPSYMFMCSMDYARFFLEKYGNEAYEKLIDIIEHYRDKINSIENMHVLGKEDIKNNNYEIYDIDPTRYVINLHKGYSGYKLLDYLRSCGIQGEMADMSNVVLIFSPFNRKEEFEVLYNVLKTCPVSILEDTTLGLFTHPIPEAKLAPYEVMKLEKCYLELDDAEGRICGCNIVPYPPGIPLIAMGEVIDRYSVDMIKYYMHNNLTVLGVKKGKICVVEE